jgi:hypothetical protein
MKKQFLFCFFIFYVYVGIFYCLLAIFYCVMFLPALICVDARAIGAARKKDVGFIPVHERHFGRVLNEDVDFTTRLLDELLDFRHRTIVAELVAVDGEVNLSVINTRDVSREERDGTAELPVSDGDEMRLTRHEDALDKDFTLLQLLRVRGERADRKSRQESGERARGGVLHRGHDCFAWIAWWYFDSTSFPYLSLGQTSVSIFYLLDVLKFDVSNPLS